CGAAKPKKAFKLSNRWFPPSPNKSSGVRRRLSTLTHETFIESGKIVARGDRTDGAHRGGLQTRARTSPAPTAGGPDVGFALRQILHAHAGFFRGRNSRTRRASDFPQRE